MDSVDTPAGNENFNGATTNSREVHDVIIVGAGAAGIGVAISVAHSGVESNSRSQRSRIVVCSMAN